MKNPTQVLLIHGGMTFRTEKDYLDYLANRTVSLDKWASWSSEYLEKKLGRKFQFIRPTMPLKENAQYEHWKIHFERYIPLLRDGVILIGSSLGGIFLARYLAENKFPLKIKRLFLVCAPFDDTSEEEDLTNGFELPDDLSKVMENCPEVHLMFSADDTCVPVSHAHKYQAKLPEATLHIYNDKNGHFLVPKFPELLKLIKKK